MTEVIILAAIALFILSRLYIALGRDDGAGDRPRPNSAPVKVRRSMEPSEPTHDAPAKDERVFTGPGASGLEEIYNADPSFNTRDFMQGAKAAYEMIVEAFSNGDKDKLRPLLDDDVYEAWSEAIDQREKDKTAAYELLRIKKVEIDDATLEEGIARVMVRYEAELGDGERMRTAKEIWTFMRTVASSDPNWLLDDVETAS